MNITRRRDSNIRRRDVVAGLVTDAEEGYVHLSHGSRAMATFGPPIKVGAQ